MLKEIASLFSHKEKKQNVEEIRIENDVDIKPTPTINPKPRICCIDIEQKDIDCLKQSGLNIESTGTLGTKVKVPNKTVGNNIEVLPNHELPNNLHEYDITILDLNNETLKEYVEAEHTRISHTGMSGISLLSIYPETVFNPRPFGSYILRNELDKLEDKKHLIICFATKKYDVDYQPIKIETNRYDSNKVFKHNIFDFQSWSPLADSKEGTEVSVCVKNEELNNCLNKYINEITYSQTFYHPTNYDNGKDTPMSEYVPLMRNMSNDIVSMMILDGNKTIFHFPQVEDKGKFLKEFLIQVAPSLFEDLFPYSTAFKWKNDDNYWLPQHKILLTEKELLETGYKQKITEKHQEIEDNKQKYSFLHDMLTESGDKLVKAIIIFLNWLEFDNVRDVDAGKNEDAILEEDIQIELDDGLLVIECKGIGGTSKDSECSQVYKIKNRRCKERGKFDVYALYIVNHQRFLPPLNRKNPPFTEHQIQDAKHDERGLVTTWQLFNLYHNIENGILSKEEARKLLLEYGLVKFKPQNRTYIDEPKEIFGDGEVCIVNIENIELSVGDTLFVEKNDKFEKVIIEDIQLNGKSIEKANKGELGLKLNKAIKKKSKLYKKRV